MPRVSLTYREYCVVRSSVHIITKIFERLLFLSVVLFYLQTEDIVSSKPFKVFDNKYGFQTLPYRAFLITSLKI